MAGERYAAKAVIGAAGHVGRHILGGRTQAAANRHSTAQAVAQHDDPGAAAKAVKSVENSRFRRRVIAAGTVGALAVGAWYLFFRGGSDTTTSTIQAGVVKVVPEEIDLRAMIVSDVEEQARYVKKDPVSRALDHVPLIGSISREVERSQGGTATFTGANGTGNGQIATLVGFKPGGITEKKLPHGRVEIDIPTRDVVLLNAINEQASRVTWNPGDMESLRGFEATVFDVGGITNGIKHQIESNEAGVEAIAREAAINEVSTSCATAAWPLAAKAATAAYQDIAMQQYQQEVAAGEQLQPFQPSYLTVKFVGPTPSFTAGPEKLPDGVTTSSVNNEGCSVSSTAYDPQTPATGAFSNAVGEVVPTNVG